jgi:Na+-translocating ferredoxin:NAD+ oxidoreductase RnfC subunit
LHCKQTKEQQKADVARERFEFKEFRVERNKAERSEMMARKSANGMWLGQTISQQRHSIQSLKL